MMEMIEANWPLLLVAFLIGLVIAWFLFNANRRTKVTGERSDVLDEGAAPAARNQALIDSAPSASAGVPKEAAPVVPPATPMGLAGAGEVVAASAVETQAERADENLDESAESPAPAAPPAPVEVPERPSKDAPLADGADDLTRIKGVGPKLANALRELGITSFAEIASWDEAEIDRIDAKLGRFQGRIRRDDWKTQAALLAGGDTAAYESKFGRLD
ncbi:hypothetical protein GCM10022600_23790 [Qipengyuania pelagi]|mgnify:CR=1 FL=1|uniref:Uncharacterized protein n=2 Tax=Qipengyuania pelagi TaxID=994320 RepID=A0A844Y467_9SPHN|nr:helix-hairpin-helix domain-containing protein [Qipengyuania pelagi]MXO52781.1 hypothetical protein [Qipengyuania pelagi]